MKLKTSQSYLLKLDRKKYAKRKKLEKVTVVMVFSPTYIIMQKRSFKRNDQIAQSVRRIEEKEE